MSYRKPELKEFVEGFEYQVYTEGHWEDSIEHISGWYPYSYNQGMCFRDLEDIERELNDGHIRVVD